MRTFLAFLLLHATQAFALPNEITAEYRLTSHGVTIGTVTESYTRSGSSLIAIAYLWKVMRPR